MPEKWKILFAAVLALGLLATGFFVGIGVGSSGSTVYSTDPAQCPTDATFCQSVNIWRRNSDAGLTAPNANKNRSSALVDA